MIRPYQRAAIAAILANSSITLSVPMGKARVLDTMNPLDKQISRLPSHVLDNMTLERLRVAMQMHNAMMSARQAGGDDAVRKWAKKNMTDDAKAAYIELADAYDKGPSTMVSMGGLIRLMVAELEKG